MLIHSTKSLILLFLNPLIYTHDIYIVSSGFLNSSQTQCSSSTIQSLEITYLGNFCVKLDRSFHWWYFNQIVHHDCIDWYYFYFLSFPNLTFTNIPSLFMPALKYIIVFSYFVCRNFYGICEIGNPYKLSSFCYFI